MTLRQREINDSYKSLIENFSIAGAYFTIFTKNVTMHSTMFEVLQKTVYNVVVDIRKIQHINFWVLSPMNTYLKVWSLIDFFSHRLPFSVCERYLCERSISNLLGGSQSVMKTSIFTRSLLNFHIIDK